MGKMFVGYLPCARHRGEPEIQGSASRPRRTQRPDQPLGRQVHPVWVLAAVSGRVRSNRSVLDWCQALQWAGGGRCQGVKTPQVIRHPRHTQGRAVSRPRGRCWTHTLGVTSWPCLAGGSSTGKFPSVSSHQGSLSARLKEFRLPRC